MNSSQSYPTFVKKKEDTTNKNSKKTKNRNLQDFISLYQSVFNFSHDYTWVKKSLQREREQHDFVRNQKSKFAVNTNSVHANGRRNEFISICFRDVIAVS